MGLQVKRLDALPLGLVDHREFVLTEM